MGKDNKLTKEETKTNKEVPSGQNKEETAQNKLTVFEEDDYFEEFQNARNTIINVRCVRV